MHQWKKKINPRNRWQTANQSKRTGNLSSLPVFLPVLRTLLVLCSVVYSWPPFCFLSSFSTNLIDTSVTVPIDVRITLLICLNSFFICIFISLIPAYVNLNMYMHFPSLPYSYTLISIFICMFCVLFYIHSHLSVFFFLFHRSNRHLCHGAYWCTHNPAHMPRLLF